MSYNADLDVNLRSADTIYRALEADLFGDQMPGNYELWTDVVPTDSETMEIDWIGETPLMEEWLGARRIDEMRAYLHTLTLTSYQAAIGIKRRTMQYNRSGVVAKRLNTFLSSQAQVYDLQSMAKLVSNPTGYDGVSLFSASHPFSSDSGSVFSNYSTNALTRANYETARAAMQSYTTEKGRNFAIVPDTIICGPLLEKVAKEIFSVSDRRVTVDQGGAEATQFGIGATSITNVWDGELRVVIDRNLKGSTKQYYWFLLDTSKPGVRPIIALEGMKPKAVNQTNMEDEQRFHFDRFIYGVEGDFSFGAGWWQAAYGAFSTTAPS